MFDRQRLFMGSWNYDQCSLRINTEIGLLMDSPELAQQVVKRFEQMTVPAASYKLVLGTGALGRRRVSWDTEINQEKFKLYWEPSRSWWQRQKVRHAIHAATVARTVNALSTVNPQRLFSPWQGRDVGSADKAVKGK